MRLPSLPMIMVDVKQIPNIFVRLTSRFLLFGPYLSLLPITSSH